MEICGDYGGVNRSGEPCSKRALKKYGGRCHQHPLEPEMDELSLLEKRFVNEYLVDGNGAAAARRAGYSPNGARVQASRLLSRANIKIALEQAQEALANRTRIDQDRVIREIASLAFSDPRNVITIDGGVVTIEDLRDLPPDITASIQEVNVQSDGRIKLKLHNKQNSLKLLCQHLGIAEESFRIKGHDGGPLQVQDMTDEEVIRRARQLQGRVAALSASGNGADG